MDKWTTVTLRLKKRMSQLNQVAAPMAIRYNALCTVCSKCPSSVFIISTSLAGYRLQCINLQTKWNEKHNKKTQRKLEFHRTHTLCTQNAPSDDCCMCNNINCTALHALLIRPSLSYYAMPLCSKVRHEIPKYNIPGLPLYRTCMNCSVCTTHWTYQTTFEAFQFHNQVLAIIHKAEFFWTVRH